MRKPRLVKIIFSYCFYSANLLLARLVHRPIILCFHRIGKPSGSYLDQRVGVTDPDLFLKLLNYLKILGYRFVSLEYLINSICNSKLEQVAVITFDDGYKDLYQNAYPILKKLNIPFTLFLSTSTVESKRLLWLHKLYIAIDMLPIASRLDILKKCFSLANGENDLNKVVHRIIQSNDINLAETMKAVSNISSIADLKSEDEQLIARKLYLTKAELEEMQERGLSIEVHGYEHLPLARLNRIETENEIRNSVAYIKQELNGRPLIYCLPYGVDNEFVRDVVRGLELQGITSIESRFVKANEDPCALPRFMILNDIEDFYKRLTKGYSNVLLEKLHLLRT